MFYLVSASFCLGMIPFLVFFMIKVGIFMPRWENNKDAATLVAIRKSFWAALKATSFYVITIVVLLLLYTEYIPKSWETFRIVSVVVYCLTGLIALVFTCWAIIVWPDKRRRS